jgi:hypothetical protein
VEIPAHIKLLRNSWFYYAFSNETGYRYLGQKALLKTVTKLGIAIEAS